jgi:hypothetical protein
MLRGYVIFAIWALVCAWSVHEGRLLLWVALWLPPFALVCWEWLHPPKDESFGFYPWGVQMLFIGIVLVVSATGILSIVRASRA